MSSTLEDLFPLSEFNEMVREGFVRVQTHPEYPYSIANYTKRTMASQTWNRVTRECRGLIYNRDNLEIVARPFSKFFNLGEERKQIRKWGYNEPVVVSDKLDGSLGILYPKPEGGYAVASRGSFTSDQARKATEIWNDKYADRWQARPPKGFTALFEIIYPENRIVLNYGDTEDLILIGLREIDSGLTHGVHTHLYWPGPKAEDMDYKTLTEAVEAPPREGKEGLVVHFLNSDQRVKIKQEDYVELHRIVTRLDRRTVWQWLKDEKSIYELADKVDEEHGNWVIDTAIGITDDAIQAHVKAQGAFTRAIGDTRKEIAENIANEPKWIQAYVFGRLDNKDVTHIVWNQVKPEAGK